jgi:hypothetical protein
MNAPDALFAEMEAMVPQGHQPFFAQYERDLLEEDLILGEALPKVRSEPSKLKAIRGSHHEAARLVGLGKSNADISLITGYSPERIWALKQDPAFQELVAHYLGQVEELYYDTHKRLAGFTNDAMEVLHERLLETPDKIKTSDLKDLLTLGLDRTGFDPKSTINTNIKAVVITNAELERIKNEASAARLGTVRQLEAQREQDNREPSLGGTGGSQSPSEGAPERDEGEGEELRESVPTPLQLELAIGSPDIPQPVDKV